jgi:hypothetical protein
MKYALFVLALAMTTPAFAADSIEADVPDASRAIVYAGGTAGQDISGDLGASVALSGALGRGFVFGVGIDSERHRETNDNGETNGYGTSTGGQVTLGYAVSGKWGQATVYTGPAYSRTKGQVDPAIRRRSTGLTAAAGSDGNLVAGPWQLDWSGSYTIKARAYEVTFDATHEIGGRLRAGLEGTLSGGLDYARRTAGAVLVFDVARRATLQLSAGAELIKDESTGGFAGLSVSRSF